MTNQAQSPAPDPGEGSVGPPAMAIEQGKFSPFAALAAIKPQVRVVESPSLPVADAPSQEVAVDTLNSEEQGTPYDEAALVAEAEALLAAQLATLQSSGSPVEYVLEGDDVLVNAATGEELSSDEVAKLVAEFPPDTEPKKPRVTPPKAPEDVSRDIGALFGPNVKHGDRYWFYVMNGEKCGSAVLRVQRPSRKLRLDPKVLDVVVAGVEGDVPEYLRELRIASIPIEIEALAHPEKLGDDEMSKKARQLARTLADIRRRMARARSRNRRHESVATQETQS